VEEGAVDQTLQALRERAARFEAVEPRAVERGDTVVVDLVRASQGETPDTHQDITIEIGATANPPGFDDEVVGMTVGNTKTFTVRYPDDYGIKELAGSAVDYTVTIKSLKRRVVPELDDEFARDLGEFDTLDALRGRVEQDLTREAEQKAEREVRADLLKQLTGWVGFALPDSLVDRELDRRIEEFARRLMEQGVDPRAADIDWAAFRQAQRDGARDSVASALVLDEVAHREGLAVSDAEIEAELSRFAERTGRTPAAVRAQLEKDGGISRLATGLRRDKAVDFLKSRATIVGD
jgi:trigger factor